MGQGARGLVVWVVRYSVIVIVMSRLLGCLVVFVRHLLTAIRLGRVVLVDVGLCLSFTL